MMVIVVRSTQPKTTTHFTIDRFVGTDTIVETLCGKEIKVGRQTPPLDLTEESWVMTATCKRCQKKAADLAAE